MMNHTIPIVKSHSSSYKNHLAPIAPAPINLAPKPSTPSNPVHVLPKPIEPQLQQQDKHFQDRLETQSLPCIITSKQWVLPPRPKAGRKPTLEKKKIQSSKQSVQPQSNVSKLSSNLTSLNLYKSQSENMNLNNVNDDIVGIPNDDLKNQLDTATEENQKLKNIISRLKKEIESLQGGQQQSQQNVGTPQNIQPIIPTEVSTPINSIGNLTSREVSPTIDPKNIQQEHQIKKPKRQYRKKKKPEDGSNNTKINENKKKIKGKKQELPTPTQTPIIDNTPSPISIGVENNEMISSNLPNLESIIEQVSDDLSPIPIAPTNHFKKSKTIKLERSMSLQPEQISSSLPSQHFKSIGLDRTMSIPMEFFENSTPTSSSNILSRTTTNTSSFDVCRRCGTENCLCLESGHINDLKNDCVLMNRDDSSINTNEFNNNNNNNNISNVNNVNNEENEFDVNFFIKSEFDEDHDEFLMI